MKQTFAALLIGALAIAFAWFVFNPSPEGDPDALEPIGTATGTEAWRRYSNPDFGFEVRIPASFEVEDSYFYYALGPGREIPGIAFNLRPEAVAGTNLSPDTGVRVEQLSRAACAPSDFLLTTATGTPMVIGGNSYVVATSSDAGAGNRYEETVYALKHRGMCYGVRFFIHSTAIENYEPGTVAPYHREGLISTFQAILGTIRFI